jgi:hypothetical protein
MERWLIELRLLFGRLLPRSNITADLTERAVDGNTEVEVKMKPPDDDRELS